MWIKRRGRQGKKNRRGKEEQKGERQGRENYSGKKKEKREIGREEWKNKKTAKITGYEGERSTERTCSVADEIRLIQVWICPVDQRFSTLFDFYQYKLSVWDTEIKNCELNLLEIHEL